MMCVRAVSGVLHKIDEVTYWLWLVEQCSSYGMHNVAGQW